MKNIFTILVGLLCLISCTQEPELPLSLSEGTITNEIHKNNVGKIVFMKDWISLEDFSERHLVSSISRTANSDFAFRMFLGKTLTFYLNQLEPDLSVRELCQKGNFQLTFYVDKKELYKYNLQTGAGSCEYKNSTTVYGIPLVNKNNPDHWGRFLWMKFMKKENGEQALSEGNHLLKIEVRPYIENEILEVGEIIAEGEVLLTHLEEEFKEVDVAIQKIELTDKWETSNYQYDKILIRELNKKIAQNYFKNITSLVVIKNQKLLMEEYFNGATRNTLHDTRSIGKTLASSILGIAIEDGYIKNENQTLGEFYNLKFYANYSEKKEKISLKSLLTMSSGIDGSDMDPNSVGNEENMYPTNDWVKFGLDLAFNENKKIGENWDYFTAGAVLLGDILDKKVPNGLQKYAEETLFKPLGISNYQWQYTPTKVPNTAGGFQMSSLDNALWGQLYVNDGNYQSKQIIPKKWIESSLTKHLSIPKRENEFYGYLLWNKTYNVNGKEIDTFYASGNGGNRIVMIDDLDIVIVLTATAYNQPYMHYQADEIIGKYILASIIE